MTADTVETTAAEPLDCTVTAKLLNPCRPWFGASANGYPQVGDRLEQLLYFEERTGRRMDMAHSYHAVGQQTADNLTDLDLYFARRPDTMLYTNWALTKDFGSAGGGNAAVNAQIDKMAASIKTLGSTRIFLTLHHEPENDLSAVPAACGSQAPVGTMGTAAEYRAMWRNVRDRFDAAGVDNVVWVMNYMNYPKFDCMIEALWPGDDLVDWISFNGYHSTDRNVSFEYEVARFYDLLTARSGPGHDFLGVPWGIAEWGIHSSTQQNAYLYYAQAKEAVETGRFPRLHFYMVFDNGDQNRNIWDFQVAYGSGRVYDPVEQERFNEYANSWALRGDGQPPAGAPTAPTALAAVQSPGQVQLSWGPAQDTDGIASYEVLRDGVSLGSVPDLTFTDAAPLEGSHDYTVRAMDTLGNVGPEAFPVTVTVTNPDTPLFSDGFTGADGSGWGPSWATSVRNGTVTRQGDTGRVAYDDVSGAYARGVLTGLAARADSDVTLSYQWSGTAAGAYLNLYLRGAGGWRNAYRPASGYGLELNSGSTSVALKRTVSGTVTTLASVSGAQQRSTAKQWLRLRVVGSTVQFKTWPDGQPEPTGWRGAVADAGLAGMGQLHLSLARGSANVGAKNVRIDDLVVRGG